MKKVDLVRILSITAVVLWMGVIFLLSAQTGENSGSTSGNIVKILVNFLWRNFEELSVQKQREIMEIFQLIVRKGAHFTEYAVLAVLAANALRTYGVTQKQSWGVPVLVCLVYAVTDEVHQLFVAGRACRALDVCIDTAGGIFGTACFMLVCFLLSKRKKT